MRHFDKIDPRLVRREVANRQYEIADEGTLFLPKSKIWIGGQFEHDVLRGGKLLGAVRAPNIVVNQGLNALLDIMFHAATQITAWYVGIYEGNYTPVATDTAATITANSASGQSITNAASKATFTINATKSVYGAFLASASAKSATTGTLFSASKFSAARAVVDDDQLLLTYVLSASDA